MPTKKASTCSNNGHIASVRTCIARLISPSLPGSFTADPRTLESANMSGLSIRANPHLLKPEDQPKFLKIRHVGGIPALVLSAAQETLQDYQNEPPHQFQPRDFHPTSSLTQFQEI